MWCHFTNGSEYYSTAAVNINREAVLAPLAGDSAPSEGFVRFGYGVLWFLVGHLLDRTTLDGDLLAAPFSTAAAPAAFLRLATTGNFTAGLDFGLSDGVLFLAAGLAFVALADFLVAGIQLEWTGRSFSFGLAKKE